MCISIFMTKLLITSGCSFSECISPAVKTWPKHLAKELIDYTHQSYAMGSQGNGLISRGIVYGVNEALKTHSPEDILVGVMWSGTDRHDFRCTNPKLLHFVSDKVNNGWIENPTSFIKTQTKHWVILNQGWADSPNKEAEYYYRYFYDDVGSVIATLEHILRVQWFLQQKKVKYFFTTYTDDVFYPNALKHVEVEYLYDMLDFNYFLPVSSEHRWVVDNSKYLDLWDRDWRNSPHHPKNEMHKEFVDQVIIPWLCERKFI